MKYLNLIIVLLFSFMASAQTVLYKTSFAPGGGSAETATRKIVYTTGEIFVAEADAPGRHLSEGFVNPDLVALLDAENYAPLPGVEIYPNPVKDILHIRLETGGNYEIYIFDLTGKELYRHHLNGNRWDVDMRNYRNGFYLLSIVDRENKRMTSIKIQKI